MFSHQKVAGELSHGGHVFVLTCVMYPTEPPIAMEEMTEEVLGNSEIVEVFRGTNILVTGATGFLGQLLVEKLLRTCNLGKLYLMIRPKKGLNEEERLNKLFEIELYERLKRQQPNWRSKVVLVPGDLEKQNLGLNEQDRAMLISSVNIIFHPAATLRFDEKLWIAVAINILGTKGMLDLAKEMPHLKAFLHVSTAYSNCPVSKIEEKFYSPTLKWIEVVHLVDSLDHDTLESVTPIIIGDWPNTYSFTKCLTEDMVRDEADSLPIAILRPSIVVNTAKEPVVSWISNVYGAVGVLAVAGGGLLKSLHCDKKVLADIVPADMCINAAIAIAWDMSQKQQENKSIEFINSEDEPMIENKIPIYNYVSSTQNPLTWEQFMKYNECSIDYPSNYCIWYYAFCLNKYWIVHKIYDIFLHLIPAIIIDFITRLLGKEPMMWKAYKKITKFTNVITYFSTRQWLFRDDNVRKLWEKLNPRDRKMFDFDFTQLDWEVFLFSMAKGMRIYIAKDYMDNLPQNRSRYRKLKYLHFTVVYSFRLLALYLIYRTSLHYWNIYKDDILQLLQ